MNDDVVGDPSILIHIGVFEMEINGIWVNYFEMIATALGVCLKTDN